MNSRVAGIKLISLGGGTGGKRKSTSDGENLVRVHFVFEETRNVLARDDASGDSAN